MSSQQRNSRRRFLRNAVGTIAAFTIVPRHVLGRGYLAPSDTLTKGVIGVGAMGRGHFEYAGTRTVAICDVDTRHIQLALQALGGGNGIKTFAITVNSSTCLK